MIDTFYVHLEFKSKSGKWSVNLPFRCAKCGVCCTLNDFLTAGEVKATSKQNPQVHTKLKALYDELTTLIEAGEAKYDDYTLNTACPFVRNNSCSIYEIRPEGCRQYPNTAFGMQTQDCQALQRFKRQRRALKQGRRTKETCYFTGIVIENKPSKPIVPVVFSEKQYENCVKKLLKAGVTKEEQDLFNQFNQNPTNQKINHN